MSLFLSCQKSSSSTVVSFRYVVIFVLWNARVSYHGLLSYGNYADWFWLIEIHSLFHIRCVEQVWGWHAGRYREAGSSGARKGILLVSLWFSFVHLWHVGTQLTHCLQSSFPKNRRWFAASSEHWGFGFGLVSSESKGWIILCRLCMYVCT